MSPTDVVLPHVTAVVATYLRVAAIDEHEVIPHLDTRQQHEQSTGKEENSQSSHKLRREQSTGT